MIDSLCNLDIFPSPASFSKYLAWQTWPLAEPLIILLRIGYVFFEANSRHIPAGPIPYLQKACFQETHRPDGARDGRFVRSRAGDAPFSYKQVVY